MTIDSGTNPYIKHKLKIFINSYLDDKYISIKKIIPKTPKVNKTPAKKLRVSFKNKKIPIVKIHSVIIK